MAAFKCQSMARDIQTQLQLTIPGITVQESIDSNFFPTLLFTSPSPAEAMFVRIDMLPDPAGHVNSLNQPQPLYAPSEVVILREPGPTAVNEAFRAQVLARAVELGAKTFIYDSTGVKTQTGFTNYATLLAAGTLATSIETDTIKANPLTNSQ